MAEHLDELARHVVRWQLPWEADVRCHIGRCAQPGQQRALMPPPDVVHQQLRLPGAKVEGDLLIQESVRSAWQVRPHRNRPRRRIFVIVAIGPMPPERSGALTVFGDAEVQPPQAPRPQTSPVAVARHALETPTGVVADDPLVAPKVTETVDQPCLVVPQPARELCCRHTLGFELGANPRHEDEVAEPGLNGRGSRIEHPRERIAHGAQTQNIKRARLVKRPQKFTDSLARRAVKVEPPQRRLGHIVSRRRQ